MLPKLKNFKAVLSSLLLLNAFILSACASQAYSNALDGQEITPEVLVIAEDEVEDITKEIEDIEAGENPVEILTHEDARDIAVAYLVEKFGFEAPQTWLAIDQTPENLLGSSAFGYTSGPWVAFVEAPVVAPQYLVYSIEIDHVAKGLHWVGKVNAEGVLEETSVSGPMQVLSVEDARDTAEAYLVEQYGWTLEENWIEQSTQPFENADVRHTFTAGPWVIQVEYLAAAPIVPEYKVIADNLTLVERWEGVIKASGELIEESFKSD